MGLTLITPPTNYLPSKATKKMADPKVDDGLKKEIEAGKTLKDTPLPETGVNTHDATLAGIAFQQGEIDDYEDRGESGPTNRGGYCSRESSCELRARLFEACHQHQRGKCRQNRIKGNENH